MSQFEWVVTCYGGLISLLMIALIFVARNGVASQKDLREVEERIGEKIEKLEERIGEKFEKLEDKIDNLVAKTEFLRGAISNRPVSSAAKSTEVAEDQ